MLKVQFLAVVFLLIVFVREVDSRGRTLPCRPRACQVSSWSEWSSCPYHCGTGGKQERTRTRTVLESCGGSCPFVLIQTRWCKRVNCQDLGTPTACGGTLYGSSGSFASPGYPGFYSNDLNCSWSLPIPTNGVLRLQFIVFETESCCDFVELTDMFGKKIERLSGFISGFTVTVRGDRTTLLRIRFTTDFSFTRQGFKAQYNTTFASLAPIIAPTPISSGVVVTLTSTIQKTTQPSIIALVTSTIAPKPFSSDVDVTSTSTIQVTSQPPFIACGGTLSGSSGSFSSPGYPGFYSNNLNCSWSLSIPANGVLRLQFIVFETESCCDFVELTDIFNQRIDSLSGSRSGFTVTVRGNRTTSLRIRFTTDISATRQGFKAQYNITFVCGGTLSGSSGSFASPGYPGFYSNNLNCSWSLSIPANGVLRLQFIVFETESCCDFVELTDIFGQRIDRFSGSRSGFTVTVRGNRTTLLRIRFTTDFIVTRQGFKAQYNITFACGGTLSGSSGSFASPGYPGFYSNNLNCLWSLSIPANGVLRLQFIVFETESFYDVVELTDIFDEIINRFSGSRPGFTVTIRGYRTPLLGIRFTTDSSVTRQGFEAQYSITFVSVTVNPSASSLPPVASSSVVTPVNFPPDVQRALVDLLRSLVQIIHRLQALVGGSFSPVEFEDFRNQTLQILQQAENQLVSSSSSRLRKREIPELSNPQDLVQMLENIQGRLLG